MSDVAYQVGIDVGGTFTDLVAADAKGQLVSAKTPTTSEDEAVGILAGIDQLGEQFGVDRRALRATEVIVLGTTIATNTMLEYSGSVTGLICTMDPPPVPICRSSRDALRLKEDGHVPRAGPTLEGGLRPCERREKEQRCRESSTSRW